MISEYTELDLPYPVGRVRIWKRIGSRTALRRAALEKLGGVCIKCNFSDPRALQIDHINGGGSREQRLIGSDGICKKVLCGVDGYQLLCANCNMIKKYELNEFRFPRRN